MTTLNKILHVDDDHDIREIARLSLEELGGYTLLQCVNAVETLQNAETFKPDLLLLDVLMPDANGMAVLSELRSKICLANTPAVFLTARDQMLDQVFDPDDLVLGVIHKPFDPVELPKTISDLYKRHKAKPV